MGSHPRSTRSAGGSRRGLHLLILGALAALVVAAGVACGDDEKATSTPAPTATETQTATATGTAPATATASPATGNYLDPAPADLVAQFPADVQPLVEGMPAVVAQLLLEVRNEGPGSVVYSDAGGEQFEAERRAHLNDWEKITGWTVTYTSNVDGPTILDAQVKGNAVEWDLFEVGEYAAAQGLIDKGDFEKLDLKYFPLEYYPSLNPTKDYALDAIPYATLLVYNNEVFAQNPPTSAVDLFDTTKFPGKRCVYDYVVWMTEWALMADGVPFDEVYDVLATEEGQARAFAKLDTIKDDIIFYDAPAQGIQFLLDGQCDLLQTFNGRPAARMKEDPTLPIGVVWQDAWVMGDSFAIPKGAPHYKAALSVFAHLSTPQNQCDMINEITYGVALNAPPFPECLTDFAKTWSWAGKEGTLDGHEGDQYWYENLSDMSDAWATWKTGG